MAVGLTFGVACTACTNGNCVDEPTPDEPLCLPIRGEAPLELTQCPNRYCGENARKAVRCATLARRGSWPILAGTEDQAQSFLSAVDLIWSEQSAYRNKLKIPDHA